MKIGNSNVTMASESSYTMVSEQKVTQTFKDAYEFKQDANVKSEPKRTSYTPDGLIQVRSMSELKEILLEQLLEALHGKRSSFLTRQETVERLSRGAWNGNYIVTSGMYKVERVTSSYYYEEETTSFTTSGTVMTQDGRQIDFGMSFELMRSFESSEATYDSGNTLMCDPLVINFSGDITQLSDEKFEFDLDGDGKAEQISRFASNSGFLALDLNGDGVINNGTELFGTKSQDGFGDLSKYDKDHNGWIDENDEIYDKLVVWTKDANGNDVLTDLKTANVGAIFLGKVSTNFSLNSLYDNSINGTIVETGIYLGDDGTTNTIQHVDFAV